MPQISIVAPAKLNLHLRIGDRRPDGFHGIESIFLALAFGDVLHFETVSFEDTGLSPLEINMAWQSGDPLAALTPEKNIISRAVSLFRSHTGYDQGLRVTVEKRIPLGGGLGGGSSDAAATLLALNRLTGGSVEDRDLLALGASLGSDVPFFLYDASLAWVSGRGERVRPLELPESLRGLSLVLVNPGFPSDTAGAYRLLDEYRSCNHLPPCVVESPLGYLSDSPKNWPFINDFAAVFRAEAKGSPFGELSSSCQLIFSRLRELGADFAGLSGSGSTCFGVFSDRNAAGSAVVSFERQWPFTIETFPLAYREIR